MAANTVREYFDRVPETGRFDGPMGKLEFQRSKQIIARFLPKTPMTILDVGAGVGAYAFWLSRMGHGVSAVEPAKRQYRLIVQQNEQESAKLRAVSNGHASSLEFADGSFDLGLCMGPLYHLHSGLERRKALEEMRRVLKPAGLLVTAYISRFSSLMDGYFRGFVEDPVFAELVEVDLREGTHDPPAHDKCFTEAYFHAVSEIEPELQSAGLRMKHLFAVESVFWCLPTLDHFLEDPTRNARLMSYISSIESDLTLMGSSAHMLAVSHVDH
jgi:ubiquinone/menaquinone biosynthesis C-methylase UbiE